MRVYFTRTKNTILIIIQDNILNAFLNLKVSVNEAAAQLCLLMPSLLNRRDELFPLARQVVRNSGYQYSKGHSRSQFCNTGFPSKLFGTNVTIKGDKVSGSSGDNESGESGKEEGGSEDGKKDRRSSDTNNSEQRKRPRATSLETEELQQRRKVSTIFCSHISIFNIKIVF